MLVLSADPLAAALLGALIETEGHRVGFARAGESARDALRRVRPPVVFVEYVHPEPPSAGTIGPAKMTGTSVVLFAGQRVGAELHECAERYGLGALVLPPLPGELRGALDRRDGPPDAQ